MIRWATLIVATTALLIGCGDGTGEPTTADAQGAASATVRLLAVGDSVLEANGAGSTPAQAARALNDRGIATVVENRAVSGSCVGPCDDVDQTIPATYSDDGWTHVLISGGGNDIGDACAPVDPVITADLSSGLMVDFIERLPSTTTVLLYLYAPPIDPEDALYSCDALATLHERYRAFAGRRENVVVVDAGSVADRTTPGYYADSVHPSPEGSAAIGALVAAVIEDTLRPGGG